MEFDWDAANLAPKEAEEAVLIEPLETEVQSHASEQRVICFGCAKSGRLLTILYTGRRGNIRVVTAYEMTMPTKQITIPKFHTEAAEAKWWDSHPDAAAEIMKRALNSRNARRAVPLKTVTMRLPVLDIQTAQDLAHQKGLPYQTYIKMLLHDALEKELRSA